MGDAAAIIAGLLDALMVVGSDGRIDAANPAAGRLFGVETARLIGSPVADWLDVSMAGAGADRDSAFAWWTAQMHRRVDVRGQRPTAESFAAEVAVTPIGGDAARVVLVVRDVTERHEMALALDEEIAHFEAMQRETIEAQQAAIRQLSSPVIRVWTDVVAVPLIGAMDTERAAVVSEALLGAISAERVRVAIVDLTGIGEIDTATASNLMRLVRSVRLLGAECLLSGIGGRIARTLVSLDVDFAEIHTVASLHDGLRYSLRQLTASRGR